MILPLPAPGGRTTGSVSGLAGNGAAGRRFGNGGALDAVRLHRQLTAPYYRVYDPAGVFLGLGSLSADGSQLQVVRVMVMR